MKHSDVIYILGMRFKKVDGRLVRMQEIGRPSYSSPYGEPTVLIRVPISLVDEIRPKMDLLRQRESELLENLRNDVLFTTPGYSSSDLDNAVSVLPRGGQK